MAANISALKDISGFIGGCLVDSETGLRLVSEKKAANFDIDTAAAANTEVVRARHRAMQAPGLDDRLEDVLVTLDDQFHLIRPLALNPLRFLYAAPYCSTANPGMARIAVKGVEGRLRI